MNKRRDIYLAKAIGLPFSKEQISSVDFSTWEGFGKLWEWAAQQEWSDNLRMWVTYAEDDDDEYDNCAGYFVKESLIDPDTFADAIYIFLKEAENE